MSFDINLIKYHHFFLGYLYNVGVCMIEKITVLFTCIHIQVKSIVFSVSIQFWDQSGLAILYNP